MKKLLAVLSMLTAFLVTSAFAQQSAQTEAPPTRSNAAPAAPQNSQTSTDPYTAKARAQIDAMIKALGGDAYLNYKSKDESGRSYTFYQGRPRGGITVYWRMWKYPDKERVEVTKQRDIAYLNVSDAGYEITFKGTAVQEADALADYIRRRDHSMEIVLRQWLKDPNTLILPAGTGIAEQTLCDLVNIVNPSNDAVTIAIDQITHLPVQKSFTWRDKDKYKVEDAEVFANYRVVQGIMTPYSWTQKRDGLMTRQRFINTIEYNVEIPESKFDAKVTYDPYDLQHKKK